MKKIMYLLTNYFKAKVKSPWKEKIRKAVWKIRGLTAWKKLLNDVRSGSQKKEGNQNQTKDQEHDDNCDSLQSHDFKEDHVIEHKVNLPGDFEVSNRSDINLINNKNRTLFERNNLSFDDTVDGKSILTLEKCNSFSIETPITFEFKSKQFIGSYRSKVYCFETMKRDFMFPSLVRLRKNEKIESSSVTVCEKIYFKFELDFKDKMLYYLRVFLIVAIFLYLLYSIATYLMGVYISYGNSFYMMSLVPAAIMVAANFVVINSLMLFFSTFLMYNFGYTFYKQKEWSFMKGLFWLCVPSQAYYLHEAMINFRELNSKYIKKQRL